MLSDTYYNHSLILSGDPTSAMWRPKAAQWLREALDEHDISHSMYGSVLVKYCKNLQSHEIDKQSTLPLFKYLQLIDTQLESVLNVDHYDYENAITHLHLLYQTLEAKEEIMVLVLKEHGWDPVPFLASAIKYDHKVAVHSHPSELDFEETMHFRILQHCKEALLTHAWTPHQQNPALDWIWEIEFIEGCSGSYQNQLDEEQRMKQLITCLPHSFPIWVNGAFKSFYTEWSPKMLLEFADMDMSQTPLVEQLPFFVRCMQYGEVKKPIPAWHHLKTKYPKLMSALETWSSIVPDIESAKVQNEFAALWLLTEQNEPLDSKIQLPEMG